jgi:hypothetical protein
MASDGKKPRKGREPPTIDATATESTAEPATDTAKPSEPEDAAPVDAAAADTAAAREWPVVEVEKPDVTGEPARSAEPESAPLHGEPPAAEPPPPARIPPAARERLPRRRSLFWPMVGSAILGAILALAALAAVWRYNVLEPYNIDVGGKLLAARLNALEAKVRDSQRPAPPIPALARLIPPAAPAPGPAPAAAAPSAPPADTKTIDELTARIAKLEAAAAVPRPPAPIPDPAVISRLGALETAVKPLGEGISANSKRDEELATGLRDAQARLDTTAKALDAFVAAQRDQPAPATKADLDKLDARITTIETATKSLADKAAAAGAADKSAEQNLRAAVLASALWSAVERSVPYGAELGALKSQIKDPQALAPLEPFAATGVPSPAALARELADIVPTITRVAEPQNAVEGGLLQRLKARASEFVQVRPVGEAPGDNSSAVVARIAAETARADNAGALADLAKLPPAARAPAQAWIAKVQAREAAVAAARRVATDALAALGKS